MFTHDPVRSNRPSPVFFSLVRASLLAMSATAWGVHAQTLPEVTVQAAPLHDDLGLSQPAQSGALANVSVQNLPASLSSVTAKQAREREDYGVADAVVRSVGLSVNASPGNGGLAFSSRGFAGVNSVGVAEDGLSIGVAAGTVTYPNDAWGYERFDVLRGPASLMYGSGSMGATVNAVRKAPSREREAEVLSAVGSDGRLRLGVGAAGPLGETLSYRVDAYGQRSDGERHLGNASSAKLMSGLRWQPNADFQLDLTADIGDQKPERYFGTPTVNGHVARELRDQNYNVNDSDIHYEDRRLRAKAQWKLGNGLSLRNEVYHVKADRHWKNIEGYTYVPDASTVNRYDYLEIGHDLKQVGNRLSAAWDLGAHQLAVGWDTSEAKFIVSNNSPYTGESVVSAFNPAHGYWDSPDPYFQKASTKVRQNALYIEDVWQLGEDWTLMAGMRRDLYDLKRNDLVSQGRVDAKLGGTSWRIGASRKLAANTNVYVQASQGHDPVNSIMSLSPAQRSFKLSQGRQVEVGVKQQLADGRGEWTFALFEIRKRDILTRDPIRPAISVQGGKQSSRGAEVSAAFQVLPALRLEGNLGVVNAKFDELLEGSTGINRAGNRPLGVPRYTANLWAHLQQGSWSTSLGLRHVGDRYSNNANTSKMAAYTVADAVVRWKINPRMALNLVARNLTNRFYASNSYGDQHMIAPGRSVELSAHWRF